MAGSQVANVFNSLPAGINSGISTGIPSSMSPDIPAGISTLNFDQNFQHVGQLRQFEPTRSQSYSTGISIVSNYAAATSPIPRYFRFSSDRLTRETRVLLSRTPVPAQRLRRARLQLASDKSSTTIYKPRHRKIGLKHAGIVATPSPNLLQGKYSTNNYAVFATS